MSRRTALPLWHLIPAVLCVASFAVGQTGTAPKEDIDAAVRRATAEREQRRAEIAELIAQATTAPTAAERGSAAFAAATASTDSAARTLHAIDAAISTFEFNLRHADLVGFKSVTTMVPGNGGPVLSALDLSQGALVNTGRNLDIGIEGNGWLQVELSGSDGPSRIGYTRNGNLFVNSRGELIVGLNDGFRVEPPITVPANATSITIAQDGSIQCVVAGATQRTTLGQLQLAMFPSAERLAFEEPGIYTKTEAAGAATITKPGQDGAGDILSGFLEQSNTDISRERLRLRFLLNWREGMNEAMRGGAAASKSAENRGNAP